MLIIKFLSFIALLGSIAWLIAEPDYEPVIAVVTSLVTFITTFISLKKTDATPEQTQVVTDGSIGVQAGGNVNTGSISTTKGTKDVE